MSGQRWLLGLALLLTVVHAHGQVYRCETDDSIVFSDQPCAEDSQAYHSIGRVSVIEPAGDLDQVAERNQAYIRDIQERQAALRQTRIERSRQTETLPQQAVPAPVTQVMYVPAPARSDRRDRRRSTPPRDSAPPVREERPFSALSGPFPGTRRSDPRERRENRRDQ